MTLSIGRLFHVVHVAEALGPLDAWYDDVFEPRRGILDANFHPGLLRDGSLIVIGDTCIETMAPSAVPGAQAGPVGRFFSRYGRHWHSLAWYSEDVGPIWDRLVGRGIRMVAPSAPEGRPSDRDIYSHPKDSLVQLEFFQPPVEMGGPKAPGPFPDPRFEPGWAEAWAARHDPFGIERMAYTTVVTAEPQRAREVFVDALEGTVLFEGASALTGTTSTYVLVGQDTIVELAVPTTEQSLAAKDLLANGDACHAVCFLVHDLDQVAAHLGARGIGIAGRDDETLLAEPADTFGAPFRFTTWRVPGDPRD